MKKLVLSVIVSVFTVSIALGQNSHRPVMPRPHFETLDSAKWSKMIKARQEFWEKQMKQNDKKWRKQTAWWNHPFKGKHGKNRNVEFKPEELMAQFVGGQEALTNWIEENITYPIQADVNGIEGKVVVTFDINKDGSISNVHAEGANNSILEDEVVNKISSMPNWIPARQNGRTVKVKYTLPISFTLLS